MGCQNSKLVNTDILAIPPKFRPLLRRKLEEIRRRRSRAAGESKKELFNESQESEALTRRPIPSSFGDIDHDRNRESMSSSSKAVNERVENDNRDHVKVENDDRDHVKKEVEDMIVSKEEEEAKLEEVEDKCERKEEEEAKEDEVKDKIESKEEEEATKEEVEDKFESKEEDEAKDEVQDKKPNDDNGDGEPNEKVKEIIVEPEKEMEKEEGKKEEEEEEKKDEEVEEEGDTERNICAGSPSFRVYYLESLEEKKAILNDEPLEIIGNNEEANTKEEIIDNVDQKTKKKSSRESSVDHSIIALEARGSNANEEDQKTKTTRMTKRGKKISRAIRKGPVAVKQFLSVKSCYHPSNESTSLLSKKTDQTVE